MNEHIHLLICAVIGMMIGCLICMASDIMPMTIVHLRADKYSSYGEVIQTALTSIWDQAYCPDYMRLTNDADRRAWADSGWLDYQEIKPPGKAWKQYRLTDQQVKRYLNDAGFRSNFLDSTGLDRAYHKVDAGVTNAEGLAESYGLERVGIE